MVRLWAEKEMRNLKRLVTAGIRCPDPIEVRENVLVMTFLGDEEGWYVSPISANRKPGPHGCVGHHLVSKMHLCQLIR